MKKMKVTVLYNNPGTSSTKDIEEADNDTRDSAVAIATELKDWGYETETMGIGVEDIPRVKKLKTDFVFNLIEWSGKEWKYGVEVISALEESGVPYSGSNGRGYQISCDKVLMKNLFDKYGIPTPKWKVVTQVQDLIEDGRLTYPVIIKPVYEHCGIGIAQDSVCVNYKETERKVIHTLDEYKQPVLVEEFIEGIEAHVTVLERRGRPWVLPIATFEYEKKSGYWPVMSYEAKWKKGSWEGKMSHWIKQELASELRKKIENIAVKCYAKLGGRDYPRLDMRIRGEEVLVLEINNNPGLDFDEQVGIGRSARMVGFSFGKLLDHIVKNALYRWKESRHDATSV